MILPTAFSLKDYLKELACRRDAILVGTALKTALLGTTETLRPSPRSQPVRRSDASSWSAAAPSRKSIQSRSWCESAAKARRENHKTKRKDRKLAERQRDTRPSRADVTPPPPSLLDQPVVYLSVRGLMHPRTLERVLPNTWDNAFRILMPWHE